MAKCKYCEHFKKMLEKRCSDDNGASKNEYKKDVGKKRNGGNFTFTHSINCEGFTFTVPDGFEIDLSKIGVK